MGFSAKKSNKATAAALSTIGKPKLPEADMSEMRRSMSENTAARTAKKATTAPAKSQSFAEAFRAARKDPDNKGTFTWRGKSFTTALASDKKAPAPARATKPAPKKDTPAPAQKGPTPDRFRPGISRTPTPAVKVPPKSEDRFRPGISRPNTSVMPADRSLMSMDPSAAARKLSGAMAKASSSSTNTTPRRPTVSEVTGTDTAGNKRNLTPDQRRKLQDAVNRSGTRSSFSFKNGGSVDGCAVRGKTRAPLKGKKR